MPAQPTRSSRDRDSTVELVRQYHGVTTGTGGRAEDVLTDDVVLHEGRQGETQRGFETVVSGFRALQESFPDFSVDIHDVVVDDDLAVSRHTSSMTFENEFDGIEPTGETMAVEVMSMFRLEEGKIAEIWDGYDTDYVNRKLGVSADQ